MSEQRNWQSVSERHYSKVTAYLEKRRGEYPAGCEEDFYDELVSALIRISRRFAGESDALISLKLEREFETAFQTFCDRVSYERGFPFISFSDPELRRETAAGMEQRHEEEAGCLAA